jgi:hypothetical protein
MFEPDRLLEHLTRREVDFVVIGGVAVGVHGVVRATKDLDIVPRPERANDERLAGALVHINARMLGVDEPSLLPNQPTDPDGLAARGNFALATDYGRLDVMQFVAGGPAYPELERDALRVQFRGSLVKVCSLEHLRTMKRAAGRPEDLSDLARLDVAHG